MITCVFQDSVLAMVLVLERECLRKGVRDSDVEREGCLREEKGTMLLSG